LEVGKDRTDIKEQICKGKVKYFLFLFLIDETGNSLFKITIANNRFIYCSLCVREINNSYFRRQREDSEMLD
jgi:hypothetical protein